MTERTPHDPEAPTGAPARRRTFAGRIAAYTCGAQAAVLSAFAVYYVVELVRGEGSDAARVLTESILILAFAAGLAVLGRLWLTGSTWAATPTVVWHLLLIPVVVAMFQSGQLLIGALLVLVVVSALAATGLANASQRQSE